MKRSKRWTGLATGACLLVGMMAASAADDFYVATNATHDFDGASWQTAFTNIQDALDVAVSNDTIHVAGHTFWLTNAINWTNSGVTIRGGYQATETDPNELPGTNNPVLWSTVIARSGVSDHRIMHIDEAHGSRLERVTITGGNVSNGAGLRIDNSMNVVLSGCIIENNVWAFGYASGWVAQTGGGLAVYGGSVTLTNCMVRRNSGRNTGTTNLARGVYGGGIYGYDTDLTILDSQILFNMAWGGSSGGIWYDSRGGGLYFEDGTLRMKNCLVAGNHVDVYRDEYDRGSGIYIGSGAAYLVNVTVAENPGDGIYQAGGTVSLTNSIVWGNWNDVVGSISADHSIIGDDPLFEYGYYLASGSPALGAGHDKAEDLGLAGYARNIAGDTYGPEDIVNLGYHYASGFDLEYADLYVSEQGNDELNDGKSEGNPLRTLKQALYLARDGSRIHVGEGEYTPSDGEFPVEIVDRVGLQILGAGASESVINRTGSSGRALLVAKSPRTTIQGVTLTGGNVSGGAGIRIKQSQGVLLADCRIENNAWTEGYTSGDVRVGGGMATYFSSVTLTNCLVRNNSGTQSVNNNQWARPVQGGGIYSYESFLTILESSLLGNFAKSGDNSREGFLTAGGGLYFFRNDLLLRNVLLTGNWVGYREGDIGDGIYVEEGTASLINSTIADNQGEGVRQAGGTVSITNSILWGNGVDSTGTVTIAWSCVENSMDYVDGGHNIGLDPLFMDAAGGDYRLQHGSPSIDTGLNQDWMIAATDLDGLPRILMGRVDMGCYETIPPQGTIIMFR